jgi:hypothetical protein
VGRYAGEGNDRPVERSTTVAGISQPALPHGPRREAHQHAIDNAANVTPTVRDGATRRRGPGSRRGPGRGPPVRGRAMIGPSWGRAMGVIRTARRRAASCDWLRSILPGTSTMRRFTAAPRRPPTRAGAPTGRPSGAGRRTTGRRPP